jgi:hypothetical protein
MYQWMNNGNAVSGATNVTYTYTPINGDVISCMMTGNSACQLSSYANSNSITINVIPTANPTISITASQNNVCVGTVITYQAVVPTEVRLLTISGR